MLYDNTTMSPSLHAQKPRTARFGAPRSDFSNPLRQYLPIRNNWFADSPPNRPFREALCLAAAIHRQVFDAMTRAALSDSVNFTRKA
jgi:hypothetical protein